MISIEVSSDEYRLVMAFRKLTGRYIAPPEYWQFVADATPGTVFAKLISKEKVSVSLGAGGLKITLGKDNE